MLESLVIMAGLLFGQVEISDSAKTYIYVSPDPPGAVVVLDGEPLGKANVLVEVSPGEHNVTMTLRGFKMENLKVSVRAGTIERVARKLQPDIEWLIGELLRAKDKKPILDKLAALGPAAEPAIPTLIDLFEQSDLELRAAVGATLQKIGKPAASSLAGLVESEDAYLRLMAARYLARIGPEVVPIVLNLVERVDKDHIGRAGSRWRRMEPGPLGAIPKGGYQQLPEWRNEELPDSIQVILEELRPNCIPVLLREIQLRSDVSDDAAFVLSYMEIPGEYAEELLATVATAFRARAQIKRDGRLDDSEVAPFLDATSYLSIRVLWNLTSDEKTLIALRAALVQADPDPDVVLHLFDHDLWPKDAARDLVPELVGLLNAASRDRTNAASRDRRESILRILGKVGFAHEQAVPTLLQALESDDGSEASDLLGSLSKVEWSRSPEPVRERAAAILSSFAQTATDGFRGWTVLRSLMQYSPSAQRVVCQSLSHESPIVRRDVADCLSRTSGNLPEEVIVALKRLLEDEDTSVRLAAVLTLSAKTTEADTWLGVARKLLDHEDPKVCLAVAPIIWRQTADWSEVGPTIVAALEKHEEIGLDSPRGLAIDSLLEMRPPVEVLRADVNDILEKNFWDHDVEEAMLALDPETVRTWVPEFVKRLDEESSEARCRYFSCLGALGSHSAGAVPKLIQELRFERNEMDEGTARVAAYTLGQIGANAKPAVPDLSRMLRYYNRQTRRTAAESLGMIGPVAEDAVPDLEKAATYLDRLTRLHAQVALTRITGDPTPAANALREAVANRVRWEGEVIYAAPRAITALSEVAPLPDKGIQALREAAEHPYSDIHEPALELLEATANRDG